MIVPDSAGGWGVAVSAVVGDGGGRLAVAVGGGGGTVAEGGIVAVG